MSLKYPMKEKQKPKLINKNSYFSARGIRILVSIFVITSAFSYLAFLAFQSATVYYLTVGELLNENNSDTTQIIRVNGKLVPGSFHRDPESTRAYFAITDGKENLNASHEGVFPDLFFNDHSEIVLEGTYSAKGIFESKNIIVKCPSKYIAES